jgi:DNA-binding CsgD family transcriptional regulator
LLDHTNTRPSGSAVLSPTERRVAELAATGMTNRDVAAVLSMSLKTVEANLRLTSLASITNSIHVRG